MSVIAGRSETPSGRVTQQASPQRRKDAAALVTKILVLALVPLIAYFVIRPHVISDTAALALAGAIPAIYSISVALVRRRVDLWGLVTSAGFAVSCIVSVLTGGSSLPLKLPDAAITLILGLALLAAIIVGRPLPIGRLVKVPLADRRIDAILGSLIGAFLILHALLTVALALLLPTASYLTAARAVNWLFIGMGMLSLWLYLRHLRQITTGQAFSQEAR
jgi:hypothetical protein